MKPKLDTMFTKDQQSVQLPPLSEDEIMKHVENYITADAPWDYLSKYFRYRLALQQKRFVIPEMKESEDVLQLEECSDVVDQFFPNGKPCLLPMMGKYVDYWIIFLVTEGRFRSDHNKKMKYYKFERPLTMSLIRWSETLCRSQPKDWVKVPEEDTYKLFKQITENSQDILIRIRSKFQHCDIKSNSEKVCFDNLNRHPEIVPFQNNRNGEHQKYLWKFQAREKGGNGGYHKPSRPICISKQSVHFILREFHEWLPSIRRRQKKI